MILFGRIAERLLDLGSTEEATALFSEARQLAQGPARRASSEVATDFAPRLARIDVGAAMGLLEPVQSMEQVEVLEKIAILVARTKPAEAERILESVKAEQTSGADPTRVCAGWRRRISRERGSLPRRSRSGRRVCGRWA